MTDAAQRQPLLSVVVPIYKVETTLNRCVKSILMQDYSALEVLLIDDGSPDGCPAMCDEWALRDSRIRVIHQANGGLSRARNAGIDHATGDFITCVDPDDELAPDTYGALMQRLQDDDEADLLEYSAEIHEADGTTDRLILPDDSFATAVSYWFGAEAYRHCYAWNKIVRRRLWDGIRFPEGRVYEDVAVLPLLASAARRIITTSHGSYRYFRHAGGISSQPTVAHVADFLNAHLRLVATCIGQQRRGEISRNAMSRYYLYVFNIQVVYCRLTHEPPQLPAFKPVVLTRQGFSTFVKSLLLRCFSLATVCRMMRFPKVRR